MNEITELLAGCPSFRARQIYKWIVCGAKSFDEMSNLPAALRAKLKEKHVLFSGEAVSELPDSDNTVKLGIRLNDGAVIEAVILSDRAGRKTACLSTQAGCPQGCVFCKTGKMGLKRNLSAQEISSQFLLLCSRVPKISNIVIMGMGEPLLNLTELRKAIAFFTDPQGLNFSKRRITVSTCGITKGIRDLADAGPDIRLAFSLITGRRELRERLMPASRENPLPLVKEALLYHQKKMERRITLEIVLLAGINTGDADASSIADFARGLDTVINLIPWNTAEGLEFEKQPLRSPSPPEIARFKKALINRGLNVTQRMERGAGIGGACGQLGAVLPTKS